MDIQIQLIPAECGSCSYLYPSGYGFDPADAGIEVSMTVFENAEVLEPCPMCGRHRSRVLAGEYQLVRDADKLLQGSGRDATELGRLVEFLQSSQGRNGSADEVRERAKEEIPELSELVEELLSASAARIDVSTWHTLLVATLRALETRADDASDDKLQPSQVIYDSVNRYNVTTVQPSAETKDQQHEAHKVGRNDPCPCGSGKKYKKCHGSPTGAASTP